MFVDRSNVLSPISITHSPLALSNRFSILSNVAADIITDSMYIDTIVESTTVNIIHDTSNETPLSLPQDNGIFSLENSSFTSENDSTQDSPTAMTLHCANDIPPSLDTSISPELLNTRNKYPNNIITAHLNINSFRSKFTEVDYIVRTHNIQILAIAETKLDNSDNSNLFNIKGYSMIRADKRKNSGGLIMYISNNIPHRQINYIHTIPNIELLCSEIILDNNDTWLVCALYKNPTVTNIDFESFFNGFCDNFIEKYSNIIIMGDLNYDLFKPDCFLKTLLPIYDLKNLISSATCKKSINHSLIDVILTNKASRFLHDFSYDIGLSDFHNLVGAVLRKHIPKPKVKHVKYRKVADIDYNLVKQELSCLSLGDTTLNPEESFNTYHSELMSIFNKHAPVKTKRIRAGDFPFMTKELKQAIYQRNMARNKYYKYKTTSYHVIYKEKRNTVNSIKRRLTASYIKQKCHSGTRNKDFWPTMKPFFTKKSLSETDIILRESNNLITDEKELCEIFNNFFVNIGQDIGTPENNDRPIHEIVQSYSTHPSIVTINNTKPIRSQPFTFLPITAQEIINIITNMETKKSTGYDDIPTIFIKSIMHELAQPLSILINSCITQGVFPSNFKMADISPVYKKKDKLNKDNYRSINLLPIVSKIFENVLNHQLTNFANTFYSKHLSGFRKNHGCNNIVSLMTETWRRSLDNNNISGVLAIDLSKAFDCMPHGLLLAKLHSYDIDIHSCTLIKSYLANRKQRVKIGNSTSEWVTTLKGVPQGSILGPTLFNIFINDLLFTNIKCDIYNYADDNTLSFTGNNIDTIRATLEEDANLATSWFTDNMMQANPTKFQIMFIGKRIKSVDHQLTLNQFTIKGSPSVSILGVEIDEHLTFTDHINTICSKTAKQINALYRIKNDIDNPSRKTIFNSFIASSLNYCSTIWMFTSRGNLDKLDKLHKRALRLTYNNYTSPYDELLHDTNTLCVYKRCLKTLATDMYKTKHKWTPSYIIDLFLERDISTSYGLRDTNKFILPRYNGKKYGYHCLAFIGPKIWNDLPIDMKNSNSIQSFKSQLDRWLLSHSLIWIKDNYF